MPSDVPTLAYLAGIVDGEGSISILCHHHARKFYVGGERMLKAFTETVQISNTSEELIEWLLNNIGGKAIPVWTRPDRLQSYRWYVNGRNVPPFLTAVLPYLVVKRAQAQLVLAFHKRPRVHGKQPYAEREAAEKSNNTTRLRLCAMNQRGQLKIKRELILNGRTPLSA